MLQGDLGKLYYEWSKRLLKERFIFRLMYFKHNPSTHNSTHATFSIQCVSQLTKIHLYIRTYIWLYGYHTSGDILVEVD